MYFGVLGGHLKWRKKYWCSAEYYVAVDIDIQNTWLVSTNLSLWHQIWRRCHWFAMPSLEYVSVGFMSFHFRVISPLCHLLIYVINTKQTYIVCTSPLDGVRSFLLSVAHFGGRVFCMDQTFLSLKMQLCCNSTRNAFRGLTPSRYEADQSVTST
jgi:hypothetical protein